MTVQQPKILIVSGTPPPYSGPEVMTAQLLNSPLKNEFNLIHFNISKDRDVSTKARFDIINIFYGFIQPLQLLVLMIKHQPDLVYTNLAQNLGGFLRYASFILLCSFFGKPIVVRVMGDRFDHFYSRSPKYFKLFIYFILKKIDRFIVRAKTLKNQFKGLVPTEKLCVVYSGISAKEFEKSRVKNNDSQIVVLFVGYLTKAKGALDLLEAVPLVVEHENNIRFQLMGPIIDVERNITYLNNPTSNEASLMNLIKHTEPYVELLGTKAGDEKISSFVNADIFVLPSYSEAFPTVVLEAMAAKLPVIATPVGALPEVFNRENIIFIDPGNVRQLASAIIKLAQDSNLRKKMGNNNYQVVKQSFNLETHSKSMGQLFSSLIQGEKKIEC